MIINSHYNLRKMIRLFFIAIHTALWKTIRLFVIAIHTALWSLKYVSCPGVGGYSHTLPMRVCATQRGRDFEAPD